MSYKYGYVWKDLAEDNMTYPVEGSERIGGWEGVTS